MTCLASASMLALPEEAKPARQPGRAGELAAGEEILRRRQIVEQREVLIDRLDAGERASAGDLIAVSGPSSTIQPESEGGRR